MTFTYNPRLAKVKGQTVQTGQCPQTNTYTDASKCIIFPAMRSLKS